MHPAASVIVFTTLSGAGLGLMVFLGLGQPPVTGPAAFWHWALAYALAVGGLCASTLHLANPRNAPKAFSQWRSSWLSREAILAVATLVVFAPFAAGAVFLGQAYQPLGLIGAVLAFLTVFATGMIYAQLRTVPRWNQPLTPALFLATALAGGAILAEGGTGALTLIALAALLQVGHWRLGDRAFARRGHTMQTATGLEGQAIRQLEPPHTGSNYLLSEMVHVVGRRHAHKLRVIGLVLGYLVPAALLLASDAVAVRLAALAAHLGGVLVLRWLFFAEAEHVVGLYYGRRV